MLSKALVIVFLCPVNIALGMILDTNLPMQRGTATYITFMNDTDNVVKVSTPINDKGVRPYYIIPPREKRLGPVGKYKIPVIKHLGVTKESYEKRNQKIKELIEKDPKLKKDYTEFLNSQDYKAFKERMKDRSDIEAGGGLPMSPTYFFMIRSLQVLTTIEGQIGAAAGSISTGALAYILGQSIKESVTALGASGTSYGYYLSSVGILGGAKIALPIAVGLWMGTIMINEIVEEIFWHQNNWHGHFTIEIFDAKTGDLLEPPLDANLRITSSHSWDPNKEYRVEFIDDQNGPWKKIEHTDDIHKVTHGNYNVQVEKRFWGREYYYFGNDQNGDWNHPHYGKDSILGHDIYPNLELAIESKRHRGIIFIRDKDLPYS